MKKIDWYILRTFTVTFFFVLLLFTIIGIVIDISEKTDDFVKSGLTTKQIITQYYYGFVPRIGAMLFPLWVFIAAIFFTSKMAGRSEVIAILASGTSYNRFLRPYLVGGLLFASMLWLMQRYIVPRANEIYSVFQVTYIDKFSTYNSLLPQFNTTYKKIDSLSYVGVNSFDSSRKASTGVFSLHRIKDNRLVYNLRAESIRWDTTNRSNKWVLTNAVERTFNGLEETVSFYPSKTMNFNFTPVDLRLDEYAKDKLSTPELKQFIRREEMRGTEGINAMKVELYKRDATPFAVIILALIGGIVASRKVRGGSGMHLAIGIVAAAAFVLLDRFSTIFSTKSNFPPLIAAWLPNIIFTGVAFFFYRRAPK
ncbi:MAG: permease [Chitinophagaceae bacterium]|jgi:lipopolysaccharide export system permease protein|nr:permease [Chitinophagaceae bacterium]